MRKIDAISRHLCKTLFTETFKIDESIKKHTLVENFCMISNKAMVRDKLFLNYFLSLFNEESDYIWLFLNVLIHLIFSSQNITGSS